MAFWADSKELNLLLSRHCQTISLGVILNMSVLRPDNIPSVLCHMGGETSVIKLSVVLSALQSPRIDHSCSPARGSVRCMCVRTEDAFRRKQSLSLPHENTSSEYAFALSVLHDNPKVNKTQASELSWKLCSDANLFLFFVCSGRMNTQDKRPVMVRL